MSNLNNISVIIINYNTMNRVQHLLDSFERFGMQPLEIIIWDNNSEDDFSIFRTNYTGRVVIVEHQVNLGFGSACNGAAKLARGTYLHFLNPDTLAISDYLSPMLSVLERNRDVGLVGCLMVDADGAPVQSGEYFHSPLKKAKMFLQNQRSSKRSLPFGFNSESLLLDVDYVSGADMLLSKQLFESVGGFDERFFLYYEEQDMQLRLSRMGLRRCLLTNVQLIHEQGGSFEHKYSWKPFYWRSYKIFLAKNYGYLGMAFGWLVTIISRYQAKQH